MKYFNTLPKIIKTEMDGTKTLYTNLLARANFVVENITDPLLYYTYDIQSGDTPEIIAEKYYGDPYRYWIVLLSNGIIDPQWDWPLLDNSFTEFLDNKYTGQDPYTDIHHYEKLISQYDSLSQTTTVNVVEISEDEYDTLAETTMNYTFGNSTCTITTTKNSVTNFEYEYKLNESKRSIKLLKKEYAAKLEKDLEKLMSK